MSQNCKDCSLATLMTIWQPDTSFDALKKNSSKCVAFIKPTFDELDSMNEGGQVENASFSKSRDNVKMWFPTKLPIKKAVITENLHFQEQFQA